MSLIIKIRIIRSAYCPAIAVARNIESYFLQVGLPRV